MLLDLAVDAEPVSPADWLAVYDVLARYCWYVDDGRIEEWSALWTEDAVFIGAFEHVLHGKEALREVVRMPKELPGTMRHQLGNIVTRSAAARMKSASMPIVRLRSGGSAAPMSWRCRNSRSCGERKDGRLRRTRSYFRPRPADRGRECGALGGVRGTPDC